MPAPTPREALDDALSVKYVKHARFEADRTTGHPRGTAYEELHGQELDVSWTGTRWRVSDDEGDVIESRNLRRALSRTIRAKVDHATH